MGGLQSVFHFGLGAVCAGICTGALSLASGSACLTGNLSHLTVRFTIGRLISATLVLVSTGNLPPYATRE
jgi:hypothetical protein